MMHNTQHKVLYIVGQTATGKSALALQLAERFNGELICADSKTVYRFMDIGTAKPSASDQQVVRHWGLNLVNPDQRFTAADFQRYALTAIGDISQRGKLPIIVGGSGLYINSLLFDFIFSPPDVALRKRLAGLSVENLQQIIVSKGYPMPENYKNHRYLMRTIERQGALGRQSPLRDNTFVIGLQAPPDILRKRIAARIQTMLDQGLVNEVRWLLRQYPSELPALQAPGYRAFAPYCDGQVSLKEATDLFVKNDYQLAKRQLTWFKRNKSIQWLINGDIMSESVALVTTFLQK